MAIEPETKNWTWVLEQACSECGFDARAFPATMIAPLTEELAVSPWAELLQHPLVRLRPDDRTWSALEYGCHVRDVLRLGAYRVGLMRQYDNPQFENWDQDATAISDGYEIQDPSVVAGEISTFGAELAGIYASIGADEWDRPGLRSDGSPFTIESFGRYFLHDPVHHVADVRRGYERLEQSGDPG
jgi:hypothetical protein